MDKHTEQLNRAIDHLIAERRTQLAIREEAASRVARLNSQIFHAMLEAGAKRTQLHDGTTVTVVEPKPRQTIKGEKLLALGVDPDKIRAATVESPVDPYVRVDAPKPGAEANAATSAPSNQGADPGTDEGTTTH